MTKREKLEVVTPQRRTRRAKHASAVPVGDRHMICSGSGIIHAQAFLRIMQGESYKFIRCPLPDCKAVTFYGGPKWDEVDFGVTREQVATMNPGAIIL